jgi:hypothetical protein
VEELYPDQLEDHYSDLARHFLRGSNASKESIMRNWRPSRPSVAEPIPRRATW